MHKLILKNMGPIQECEMNIDDFTVLTGVQASGKSTIAKAIFFFRCDLPAKMDTKKLQKTK